MHRCIHGSAPNYLSDYLMYVSDVHSHQTRSQANSNLYESKPNIDLYKQSFAYTGPMTWNSLSNVLKATNELTHFKVLYKDLFSSGNLY
jgi:hypothetical protein